MTDTDIPSREYPPLSADEWAQRLRQWADALEIPSGPFVNDDLRGAADFLSRLTVSPLPGEIAGLLALREGLPEGPWKHDPSEGYGYKPRVHGGGRLICEVGNAQDELWEQWEIEARAIAALPSLFAALERMAQIANVPDGISAETDAIIAAQNTEIERLRRALSEAEEAAGRMAEQIANDEAVAAGYGPDEVLRP